MQGWPANDANCPLLFNFCSGFIAGNGDRRSFIIQEVQYVLFIIHSIYKCMGAWCKLCSLSKLNINTTVFLPIRNFRYEDRILLKEIL
jgi:hypothetical protein